MHPRASPHLDTLVSSRLQLDRIFGKYGRIRSMDIKASRDGRGPAYAFVDFNYPRDAYDAVRGEDGMSIGGYRMRCEESRSDRGPGGPPPPPPGGDFGRRGPPMGGPGPSYGGGGGRSGGRAPPMRTNHRVRINNLPPSASWQDLKDFVRPIGEAGFSETYPATAGPDGAPGAPYGIVEFVSREIMERALRELNGTEFKNKYGDTSVISMEEHIGDPPPQVSHAAGHGPRGGQGYAPRGAPGGGYPPRGRDDRGPPRSGAPYEAGSSAGGGRDRSRSRERAPVDRGEGGY